MAYVQRKANRPHPVELLARDLAHAHVKAWLRKEIWNLLREAGLVTDPEPPSLPPRPKPQLRVIRPDPGDETPEG